MNRDAMEQIARAVLYEGYLLYPYRATSIKNRQRWTFGGLYPPGGPEPSLLRTQVLVRGAAAKLEVEVRFLHLLERWIRVTEREPMAWQEAEERRVMLVPDDTAFEFPGQSGDVRQAPVRGIVSVRSEDAAPGLRRITIEVRNLTARGELPPLLQSLASTHVLMGVEGGEFVSLLEPPPEFEAAAEACRNEGAWPVLVGDRRSMLASPIILYDYPKIAPESPGDLFDATEIDEILTLRILTMTDAEKREMAALDPRAKALLERTEALGPRELARLHGARRDSRPQRLVRWRVGSHELAPGTRVRLRPGGRADIMDLALAGKTAVVDAIEQDFEERVHIAVTLDDDPGRDLGAEGKMGHRFFFRPEEVEPVA
jgi:hydrogenase maturation protease